MRELVSEVCDEISGLEVGLEADKANTRPIVSHESGGFIETNDYSLLTGRL